MVQPVVSDQLMPFERQLTNTELTDGVVLQRLNGRYGLTPQIGPHSTRLPAVDQPLLDLE